VTTAATPSTVSVRLPAWLLNVTLPAFVAFLVVATVTIATEVDATAAELSPSQLQGLGVAWVALAVLWVTPPVLAAIGLDRLARTLRLPPVAAVRILAGVAVVLAAAYVVVQLLAFGFDGQTWGDSPLYGLGVTLSVVAWWAGVLPATFLVGVALARRGIVRKTAWTVSALVVLYLVFDLVTYLPALFGPASLADVVGLPPFLLGVVWAALGVGLLRSDVSSGV
jgi:hypothetical protein